MGFASQKRQTNVPHIAPFSDGNAVISLRIEMYPGFSFQNKLAEAESLNVAMTTDLHSLRLAAVPFE